MSEANTASTFCAPRLRSNPTGGLSLISHVEYITTEAASGTNLAARSPGKHRGNANRSLTGWRLGKRHRSREREGL